MATQYYETACDFGELVEHLRSAGFQVDTRQYLTAHELLLAYAGQGKLLTDDPDQLISHLGPIFCTSPEEQARFANLAHNWLGFQQVIPQETPKVPVERWWQRRWVLPSLIIMVVIGIMAGVLVYHQYVKFGLEGVVQTRSGAGIEAPAPEATVRFRGQPVPLDLNARFRLEMTRAEEPGRIEIELKGYLPKAMLVGSDSATPLNILLEPLPPQRPSDEPTRDTTAPEIVKPLPAEGKQPNWPLAAGLGGGAAALMFVFFTLYDKGRRRLVLQRLPIEGKPELIPMAADADGPSSLPEPELRRLISNLRRQRSQPFDELDIASSTEATARNAGLFSPMFRRRRATPEYLALISRHGSEDHQAKLYEGLVGGLRDRGVMIEHYYFREDPRYCSKADGQIGHYRLRELGNRHYQTTLFLFVETSVCFNPVSGQLQSWVSDLDAWSPRVLFTPEPPYHWTHQEWELAETGLIVLPAGEAGLQLYAAIQDDWGIENLGSPRYARSFPSLIGIQGWQWLDRNAPPHATVDALLRQLRGYLGPVGFAYLCACAVYPEISWPLTLHLLRAFPKYSQNGRGLDSVLPALARLPWFRHGFMPDWLRHTLITQLSSDDDKAVRDNLLQLLEKLAKQALTRRVEGTSSALHIAPWIAPNDVLNAAPPDSPLSDTIFIAFMTGASLTPLSNLSPAVMQQLFRWIGLLPEQATRPVPPAPRSFRQHLMGQLRRLYLLWPNAMRLFTCAAMAGVLFIVLLFSLEKQQIIPPPPLTADTKSLPSESPKPAVKENEPVPEPSRTVAPGPKADQVLNKTQDGDTRPQVKAKPRVTFIANPNSIQQGQATVLTWKVENAKEVKLKAADGESENVMPLGQREVRPNSTTTYTLSATSEKGPTARKTVTVGVTNDGIKYGQNQIKPDSQEASDSTPPKTTAQQQRDFAARYLAQGRYADAEPLYRQALAIDENALGPNHPEVARDLTELALVLKATGNYAAARPLFERALKINEQALGPTHPTVATSLNNLARLLQETGDYAEARPLMERALRIREQALGPTHPDVATSLNNLALLLKDMGKYAEARPLMERALRIREQALGPTHPDVAKIRTELEDMKQIQDPVKRNPQQASDSPAMTQAQQQTQVPPQTTRQESVQTLPGITPSDSPVQMQRRPPPMQSQTPEKQFQGREPLKSEQDMQAQQQTEVPPQTTRQESVQTPPSITRSDGTGDKEPISASSIVQNTLVVEAKPNDYMFSPDGRYLAYSTRYKQSEGWNNNVWDTILQQPIGTQENRNSMGTILERSRESTNFTFSSDSRYVRINNASDPRQSRRAGGSYIFELPSGKTTDLLERELAAIRWVTYKRPSDSMVSPDGRLRAYISADGILKVERIGVGEVVAALCKGSRWAFASPDGGTIIASCEDRVQFWKWRERKRA